MTTKVLVQAKIESALKKKAEKCLSDFGLDTSSAIRMFLIKVVQTGQIPFSIGYEKHCSDVDAHRRGYNSATLKRIKDSMAGIGLSEKVYNNVDELFNDILNEKD